MEIATQYKAKYYSDRSSKVIDSFVFHSTELTFEESLKMLMGKTDREVSSHYLIDLAGEVFQLVDPMKKAWHAGESFWRGRKGLNEYSIGFELVDTDEKGNQSKFTNKQMNALEGLCKDLMKRFNIDQRNIVAHSDIAPQRKQDPGENFDWKSMNQEGIGIFHDIDVDAFGNNVIKARPGDHNNNVYLAKKLLKEIGYLIDLNDIYDKDFSYVIVAFKRRFIQKDISDSLDELTLEVLTSVAERFIQFGN
ncbi:MAG: N-acetylmuramoyl-L-alanine amidase [Rickettsiales bacterium]